MSEQHDDEFGQFEKYDANAAEERMRNGGMIPAGKYPAMLIGAKRTVSKQKDTPGWELTFAITGGAFKGSEVIDTLYITDNSKSRDRLVIFGHRLGLLTKKPDGSGYVKVEGKTDLTDCLDTACVIETIHEQDRNDPNKKWVRLAFGGVFTPDDPAGKETKDKDKGEKKSEPAKSKTGGGSGGAGGSSEPVGAGAGGGKERKKVGRGEL